MSDDNSHHDPAAPSGYRPEEDTYSQAQAHGYGTYGQQQYQAGYDQQQYGTYGQQQYQAGYAPAPPRTIQYAHWGKRVLSGLIDFALTIPFAIVTWFFSPDTTTESATGRMTTHGGNTAIVWLFNILSLAVVIWNQGYRQGRTGQSIGKQVIGTKLIDERTDQPLGFGKAVLRQIVHVLDAIPCYLGFLWPLWDAKRQTFADKIMSSVVVEAPRNTLN